MKPEPGQKFKAYFQLLSGVVCKMGQSFESGFQSKRIGFMNPQAETETGFVRILVTAVACKKLY